MHWQPSASLQVLTQRANILAMIRRFFADHQVLEVDTPLLSPTTVTDPYVIGIPAFFQSATNTTTLYLQTSPEYAMKRLLAAGSGSIYQICKAFRQADLGRIHQPEFTMLEWYRVGFDHHALMDEMDDLLQLVLNVAPSERSTYHDLFMKYLAINPHTVTLAELRKCVHEHILFQGELNDRNTCLDLLLTHCLEPLIGRERPFFLYDFPVEQAALAKIRPGNPAVASRFEVYFKGVELANGFHELQDSKEQRNRFAADLKYRAEHGLPVVAIDEHFLAALEEGIPDCAGVALGVDRLLMLLLGHERLADVVSFAL